MGYDYGFEYSFPEAMEGVAEGALVGAAGIMTGILLLIWLIAMAFSVVSYVLNAVGMYRIAKRRGIHHGWLAWIPVGSSWLLGSISDHYQYVVKQKTTKRRNALLILNILCLAMGGLFGAGVGMLAVAEITGGVAAESIATVAVMAISYLGLMGLGIAVTVFCYIAYFDLFRSCKPKYDVLFLVLGIFFNVTLPFFVFACSGSDEGMPARRPVQNPAQIPYEPVVDTPVQPEEPQAPAAEEIPVVEAEIVEDPE
ncbi:MAG: hypothetical protein IKB09_07715 [Oscillospiraceae bacterium]|nr:hypothetical protein [Oscillospiraceae bacterium]